MSAENSESREPQAVFNIFLDRTSGSSFEPRGLSAEFEVVCKVFAVLPEFRLAYLRDEQDYQYAINKDTPGVNCADLSEGQEVRCSVSVPLRRVTFAELIS